MKKQLTFTNWKKHLLKNPKIKEEYELLKPEMAVIKAVIEARLEKKVTQKELAKKIGTKQSVISRLESGRANPSIGFLQKFAKALDFSLEIRFVPR